MHNRWNTSDVTDLIAGPDRLAPVHPGGVRVTPPDGQGIDDALTLMPDVPAVRCAEAS